MPVIGITRPGLAGLAVSVMLLWGCFLTERTIVRRASAEQARALRTIQGLRDRQAQPVSTPTPWIRRPRRAVVG